MKVICEEGVLSIVGEDGIPVLSGISCGIRYSGPMYNEIEQTAGGPWQLQITESGWQARCAGTVLYFLPEGQGISICAEYCNSGADISAVTDFIALRGTLCARVDRLCGSTLSRANGNRTNEMQSCVETLRLVPGQSFQAADFCAFTTDSHRNYIAGYLTYFTYFGSVSLAADGTLEAACFAEYHPLQAGGVIKSELFYFTECSDPVTGLPLYAERVVQHMTGNPPIQRFSVPTGYCTWYYYMSDINDKKVSAARQSLAACADRLPVRYFQIDDGWENHWGDWEANEKFQDGMQAHAQAAKEAGFIPGIWLAPFGAGSDSKIFQAHPEYFIRQWNSDEPHLCGWGNYGFDFSVPGARQYLADLIKKVTYDWGYRYLKLDIITSTIGPYRHSDPAYTACRNFREGMRIIREAATPDTFILGCTAPFGGAVGLVDGMRVSCDIFERWDSICGVFNAVLKRYFYHKKFFLNDADCLIIRKTENEDEDCRRLCLRTDDEIKSYIAAAAASGGALMLSDKLSLLSEKQIHMLSCLFPVNEEAALPLDLMDSRIPGILDTGTRGKNRTVILINWENTPKEMRVYAGNAHVFSFWNGAYGGVVRGTYAATLQPHCSEVLCFTQDDTPAVIGCDSVLIPNILQFYENGLLTTTFIKKGETQFVAAQSLRGDGCEIVQCSEGLFQIKQRGEMMRVRLEAK